MKKRPQIVAREKWPRQPRWSGAFVMTALLVLGAAPAMARTSNGALLPGPSTRWALGVETQAIAAGTHQPGRPTASSALMLHVDDSVRSNGAAFQWGLSAGAMQSAATPQPDATTGGVFRLRLGGAMDLFGWNMLWPGELLLTGQGEVAVDGRDVLFDGTRAAAFVGLRLLAGYGDALRMAIDVEVAPIVFGSTPGAASTRVSVGRARVSFGLERVQLCAELAVTDGESMQQGQWRALRAFRAGASLVVGLGGE